MSLEPSTSSLVPAVPWYRYKLVWMIIAIPAASVIAGINMIYLAVNTDDGLVVDDYYKEGMAAPMGGFSNYQREPLAVLVVDRRIASSSSSFAGSVGRGPAAGRSPLKRIRQDHRTLTCASHSYPNRRYS